MNSPSPESLAELDRFLDEQRDRCLWFLRRDHYPRTPDEIARALGYVRKHGDLAAFQRAAEIESCLFPPSN